MTYSEFKNLEIGEIVCNSEGELWRITGDHQFGPDSEVFAMKKMNTEEFSAGRISKDNFKFWEKVNQHAANHP